MRRTGMRRKDNDTSDEMLVRRVLSGDRRAFAPLLENHQASVVRLCRRVLGSRGAAEDVAQEAALRAFLDLGRLKEPRRFSAWLHSIHALRPLFDEHSLPSKQAWPDWHRQQFGKNLPDTPPRS